MRRTLVLLIPLLMFLLFIPKTQQVEEIKLKKLEPKLRALTSSPERVRVIVWLDDKRNLKSFENIGEVRYDYNIISAVAMEVSYQRLKDLVELPNVKKIVLDRRVRILRMDSIPLIKADLASNNFGINGTGINISIIDTGIFNHTEFQTPNRIVKQKCYCEGCCPPNNVNEGDNATDDNSHGTHCAGIAGGEGDSNGYGVATNASLFAVKVLNSSGSGTESDVIAGIEWAVNNGANVISLSLGGQVGSGYTCYDYFLSEAVDNATKQGVVVVVAAGNDGPSGESIETPGCAKRVITVGNTNDNDNIVSSSSRGPTKDNRTKPDLTAPGDNIYSTINSLNGYGYKTGTSMSTPHVAGVAALLIQNFSQTFGYFPEPERVKAIILTAVNTTGMNNAGYQQRNNIYGSGRVDAYEVLTIINKTRNGSISQGQTHRFNLNVTDDLKLTLYWPEDKDTNNDLNLLVGNRSYNYSYPTDANDSVEQVFLYNPEQRVWKVYVEGDGSDQDYYLASNMEIIDDVTPPALIMTEPENKTYNIQVGIPLNFSTDSSNETIWYTIDDINETVITGNTSFNVSSDGSHRITLYVNDSYDNINQSVQYFSVDTTPPQSSDDSTNTTVAGVATEFRLRWTDNVGLDSYVFSLDNCTGFFSNITETNFPTGGAEDWSNETYVINDTVGCTIRWKAYANDTSDIWNESLEYTFATIDGTPPQWSSNKTFPTNPTYFLNQTYQFNITWVDNIALDTIFIEHNFTVSYVQNDSFTGNESSEYYFDISDLKGGTYVWRSFGNDTYNNWNVTDEWTYTINKASTQIELYLNGTRGNVSYEPNQTANFTVALNVSGEYVNLTTNISGWVDLTNVTPLMNHTKLMSEGVYNITGYWLGDVNYTPDSETWFATVSTTTTTTTTTSTTTLGGNGNGYTPEENITATKNQTLVPGVLLGDDTNLQSAIKDILGEDELSLQDIENLIDISQSITPDVQTMRSFIVVNDTSTLSTHLKYKGDNLINFIVYDVISKNFSQSSGNINVSATGSDWEVVEEDPSFVFLYSTVSTGDEMDIVYEVDEEVDPIVINETSTYVFAEGFEVVTTTTTTTIPVCGDNVCSSEENCGNCLEDCPCPEGLVCKDDECLLEAKVGFNWFLVLIPIIIGIVAVIGWRVWSYREEKEKFERLKEKWRRYGGDFKKLKEKWTKRSRS